MDTNERRHVLEQIDHEIDDLSRMLRSSDIFVISHREEMETRLESLKQRRLDLITTGG
jgi:hypothetical protein